MVVVAVAAEAENSKAVEQAGKKIKMAGDGGHLVNRRRGIRPKAEDGAK